MDPSTIVQKLRENQRVFENLLKSSTRKEYSFRPDKNTWCLLEVICHLLDEEVEDFRARIHHILTSPPLPLKAITPHKWPVERSYLQKNYNTTLQ